MASPTKLQLRVLYTINSSPQYILARSHSQIPVTPISEPPPDNNELKYATVSLGACLDTICRSSPELIQDNNRDYSLYVLDPLESNSAPAPMNISNSNTSGKLGQVPGNLKGQPHGVAVGLGLMSWALNENDGIMVTGTQVKMNTGQDALEVIFALRETAAMQRASLTSTIRSWGIPLGMSFNPHISESPSTVDPTLLSLSNPQVVQPTSSTSSSTDRLEPQLVEGSHSSSLKTSATFQTRNKAKQRSKTQRSSTTPTTESDKLMYASETYFGPLKKKGRPKNSSNGRKVLKNFVSDGENNVGAVLGPNNLAQIVGQTVVMPTNRQGCPPNPMPPTTLTQPLASSLPGTSAPHLVESQASVLDLLMALSNCTTLNSQNPHLLATLSMIDSSNTGQQQPPEPNPALVNAIGQLLLRVYAQQPAQTTAGTISHAVSQDEDVVILDKENVDPLAFKRRAEKETSGAQGSKPAQSNGSSAALTNSSQSILGQRSDSQENAASGASLLRKRTLSDFLDEKESERSKQKEKERSERKEHRRHLPTRVRRSSGSSNIYDTGFRHYPRITSEALPRPGLNSYYRTPFDFRSSPPRFNVSSDFACSKSLRRSEPKVPASSPPRTRSPRKPYVIPEWARTNTAMQPRLSEEAQKALEEAKEKKTKEREAKKKDANFKRLKQESRVEPRANQARSPPSSEAGEPFTATKSCPVFANISDDIFSSVMGRSSLPHSPPPSCSAIPIPQTPPPNHVNDLFTPENGSGSLFTPTPKGKNGRFPSSTGNTLLTPGPLSPSPSSVRCKSAKMSPIQAVICGKNIDGASGWNGTTVEKVEYGWDEPDAPPSSLPTASDAEDEMPTSSTCEAEVNEETDAYSAGDEDDQDYTVKQHWPGLPPSSPPPPSSPSLIPKEQDDDDVELMDLPVATSDLDETISPSLIDIQQLTDEDEPTKDEFESFIASLSSDSSMPSDIDLLNQLSTGIHESNDTDAFSMLNPSLDPIFQNGLVGFDFTEFWESFKPIVEENVNYITDSDKNLDHNKLAEDVQALLSGCLM